MQAQRGGRVLAPTHPQSLCWKGVSTMVWPLYPQAKDPVPIVWTNIKQK